MQVGDKVTVNDWRGTLHSFDDNGLVLRDAHYDLSMGDPSKILKISWDLVRGLKVIRGE